MYIIFYIM